MLTCIFTGGKIVLSSAWFFKFRNIKMNTGFGQINSLQSGTVGQAALGNSYKSEFKGLGVSLMSFYLLALHFIL